MTRNQDRAVLQLEHASVVYESHRATVLGPYVWKHPREAWAALSEVFPWEALVISLVVAGGLWRSYGSHIGLSLGFCVALALSVLQLLRTKSFVTGAEIVQQRGFFARRVTPLVSVKRGRIFPLVGAPNVGDIVLETVSGKVRLRSVSEPENILARLFSMRDALKENRVQ